MSNQETTSQDAPRWQPIEAHDRRVLGVLVEKAKTTPDSYPLSLNALRNGCNQKSNRFPQMELEEHHVEDSLERLRKQGAVSIIQGDSRIDKYRHRAYEWLGVDKVELAVMAELLLRGAQTVGDLRGRAARMEPIKGQSELRPIIEALEAMQLIVYLTSKGRGAVLTHTLYIPREMDKVRREYAGMAIDEEIESPPAAIRPAAPAPSVNRGGGADLASELRQMRDEVANLRVEFASARSEMESALQTLRDDLDTLTRELGG